MNGEEKLQNALSHKTGPVPFDMGGTGVSGIHVLAVQNLRRHFGLEDHPIKVTEPYQMLGEVEDDLIEAIGIDVIGIGGKQNMFGIINENWRPMKTFWGQEVLVPGEFNTTTDEEGNLLIHPEGDLSFSACAKMPKDGYFFDAVNRQGPIDDSKLKVEDNLEEYSSITSEELEYLRSESIKAATKDKGVIGSFGGTALGDIALVPGMQLKNPKGIRDVADWYMSTVMRADYIKEVFSRQTDIAVRNLEKIYDAVGNRIQAIFICGTDFGTQDSQFCSVETFNDLYAPYYKKVNAWIHENTQWRTFKHSCGSVNPLMNSFIEAGFDIINPVQINAANMDPQHLKSEYGERITFWGGGVDTQVVLPFGKPEEVSDQVKKSFEIFGKNGGFVFNTVHNIQANVPVENLAAMIKTLNECR